MVRPTAPAAAAAVAIACLAACQPMYGAPPEKLRGAPRTTPPKTANLAPAVAEIDDCDYNFHLDPHGVTRQPKAATNLVVEGDGRIADARREREPEARVVKTLGGLEKYRAALLADPYHAEATLDLAVQYDVLHRKGCALALLRRIGDLQTNPTYAGDAARAADRVADNAQWFTTYRPDALKAVNR